MKRIAKPIRIPRVVTQRELAHVIGGADLEAAGEDLFRPRVPKRTFVGGGDSGSD